MRQYFIVLSSLTLIFTLGITLLLDKNWSVIFLIVLVISILGYIDMFQTKHTIRRIYPVLGRFRYIMEELRPKLYQYFIESDIDGRPFSRIERSTVYQRAKQELETIPFGT